VLLPFVFMLIGHQSIPEVVTFLVDNRNDADGYLHSVCRSRTTQIGYVQPAGVTLIQVAQKRICPGGDITISFPTHYVQFPAPRIIWNQVSGVLICTRQMGGRLVFANRELTLDDAAYAPRHCNRIMDWPDESALPTSA
jgi:hypothetical protein